MANLYVHQKLRCKNGELVKIVRIENENIYVEYKGKIYSRPSSVVGEKLFIMEEDVYKEKLAHIEKSVVAKKINNGRIKDKYAPIAKRISLDDSANSSNAYQRVDCDHCALKKRDECFGKSKTCEFFRAIPSVSKNERDNWPKEMQGPYGHKRRR